MRRIRQWIEEARSRKNCKFDDLNKIARRCAQRYSHLFPKYKLKKEGSSYVHHFNVEGVEPISLEKEHGSREFVPKYYAKLALNNLEALANYIESKTTDSDLKEDDDNDQESQSDDES